MKYYFQADAKQRAQGFPFYVDFDSNESLGVLSIAKNEIAIIKLDGEITDRDWLYSQLDMYLTGEAFLD